jgi:hypothetical protein
MGRTTPAVPTLEHDAGEDGTLGLPTGVVVSGGLPIVF